MEHQLVVAVPPPDWQGTESRAISVGSVEMNPGNCIRREQRCRGCDARPLKRGAYGPNLSWKEALPPSADGCRDWQRTLHPLSGKVLPRSVSKAVVPQASFGASSEVLNGRRECFSESMISRAHPAVNEQNLSMERLETIWRYRVGWKGAAIDRYQQTVSLILDATCYRRAERLWQRPPGREAALWCQSPTRD